MISKKSWIKLSLCLFLLISAATICRIYIGNRHKKFLAADTITFTSYKMYQSSLSNIQDEHIPENKGHQFSSYTGGPLPEEGNKESVLIFESNFQITDTNPLYLFVPTTEYPLRIYVNDSIVYTCGNLFSETANCKFFGERIPIAANALKEGTNSFTVLVSPKLVQTELPHFEIGTMKVISRKALFYTILHFGTHLAFAVVSLVLFIFLLAVWLIRPKDKSILMFAFTALFIGSAYLNMIFSSSATDNLLLWQISRVAFLAAGIMIMLFTLHKTYFRINWPTLGLCMLLIAGIGVHFLNLDSRYAIQKSFSVFALFTIAPVMLFVPILFITHYFRSKELSSLILFTSSFINSLTSIHDLLFNMSHDDPYVWLLPYGFYTIQMGISLLFILELRTTYQELRDKKEEAEKSQRELITARDLAKSANSAKSEFLAKMSHEIRTPINGIIGMNNLILSTELDDTQKSYAEVIHKSSDDLLEIINDILDFSKIEAGKMSIEESAFNLRSSIDEVVNVVRYKTDDKSLGLHYSLDKNIETFYMGASGRIKQIFNNLLNNAIKFTEKGSITIKGNLIGNSEEKHLLRFEITDTGIGLSEENQKAIFQSFTQADSSTTRKYGGTGLGLTICKEFCALMGGEIGVESTLGEGSTFWFTLPLKPIFKEHEQLSEIDESSETLKPSYEIPDFTTIDERKHIKILLAEDNPVNQKVAHGLLSKFGYTTHIANNGYEVLDAMSKEDYDLILMDCHMPELDGYEAAAQIRETGNQIPIVALTANAMAGDREKCIQSGMNNYMVKPLRPDILTEIISLYTDKSS